LAAYRSTQQSSRNRSKDVPNWTALTFARWAYKALPQKISYGKSPQDVGPVLE
jgi:hypothetical protein